MGPALSDVVFIAFFPAYVNLPRFLASPLQSLSIDLQSTWRFIGQPQERICKTCAGVAGRRCVGKVGPHKKELCHGIARVVIKRYRRRRRCLMEVIGRRRDRE